jgi:hypothetical protein
MTHFFRRLALALALALTSGGLAAARADSLPPGIHKLFDGFYAHRRVAVAYLRTGNPDLAAVEIERLRHDWIAARQAVPDSALSEPSLALALGAAEKSVSLSAQAANVGEFDRARALIESAAAALNDWRKANGMRLFRDCIAEIGGAYEQLDRHADTPPNLDDIALGGVIVAIASLVESAVERCEEEAAPGTRANPEFQRLFGGMRASLRQVPAAVAQRDGDYLHRLLIEQRSFERLLAFHFG